MQIGDVIPNFRDLGGLPAVSGTVVPHGRFVRTAALLRVRGVRAGLLDGRIPGAAYFDLRTEAEVERHGPLALPEDWTYRHRPVLDTDLGQPVEPDRFDEALARYRPIVLEVAEQAATSPVVVACSLGKDRTGFVAAALLHMLGVSRETIVDDYERSNACLARFRFDRPYTLVEAHQCAAWIDFLSDHLDAPPAVVARLRDLALPHRPTDFTHAPG